MPSRNRPFERAKKAGAKPDSARRGAAAQQNRVRIIAGEWRGRWISFEAEPGLRPTGDRMRETLFNWLQFGPPAKRCLDLFAGSGALGIEAASRGAEQVVLVERNSAVATRLRTETAKLSQARFYVVESSAERYLASAAQQSSCKKEFDLVFIDPPFETNLQLSVLQQCIDSGVLAAAALVYLEAPAQEAIIDALPADIELAKSKLSGNVQSLLLRYTGVNTH